MRVHIVAAALCALAASCAHPAPVVGDAKPVSGELEWDEVTRLQRARDYFTLRDRLAAASGDTSSLPVRFARALVEHAFNSPAASNRTIGALLRDPRLPPTLVTALRKLEVTNYLRQFEYAAGLAAVDTLMADTTTLTTADLRDLRHSGTLLRALATVPPQAVVARGPATLHLEDGRIPVQINDSLRHYVFDTGANLSTIMRSEAVALALRLYPAGIDVGTSTDRRVTADLAVADRLELGPFVYRHVVFLVLDDSLLTFPGGFRIPGIVGFPVIEQLGEVQFGRGEVIVPGEPPRRTARNLALDELTPLTRVRWEGAGHGATLLCRLDTGADRTQFYEPFYRRFRGLIDSVTVSRLRRSGGAGGIREFPVRMLSRQRLAVGDTVAALDSSDVLTQSIARDSTENYLDCNIGHDVLDAFPRTIINFHDMAFLLR
jgi:aspartyl protease